jgi:ATP-binding cassette subfamily C protein CydC
MNESLPILRRLLRQVQPLSRRMALAVLLGVLTIVSSIGLIALSAYLISDAALRPSMAALAVAILGVQIFGVVRGILRYLERLVSHDVTFRLLTHLRVWFYSALEPLAPARLIARSTEQSTDYKSTDYTSGDLLSCLVADIETLQEFYIRVIAPPFVALAIALVTWFILGAFNILFAIIFLSFFLIAGVILPLLTYILSRRLGRRIIAIRAALHMNLVDSIQGIADLLTSGQEYAQVQRTRQLNQELVHLQTIMDYIGGLREALNIIFTDGCAWVLLLVAIPLVRAGVLNGVYLALIVLAVVSSFEAIPPLSQAAQQLGSCLTAARRLFDVIDAQPVVYDPQHGSPEPSAYDLEVRQLSFRYGEHLPESLHNISFSVPQGHCIAIVGPSGAGKSTLASLLLRFWEYDQGSIKLGSQELRTYQQGDLHRMISVVEQHTHLFNATIRENLLLARPDASMAEVEEAARQACIHDFIQSLPSQYETLIGEQGFHLSGGERQRLAIARALLKNAPVLLLDEATANLDTLTEQSIISALRTLIQGRTTLIITHRLVGLDMADEILVLQNGKIKERGIHHELLQAEGLYWKLYQLQSQVLTA